MKCLHCGGDTKYKERSTNGGRCAQCHHPFAFEPRSPATLGITDGLFDRVRKDVSGDDTVWYTERQLWHEFNRRLLRKRYWRGPWGAVTGLSVVGGIAGTILGISVFPVNLLFAAAGAGGALTSFAMNRRARRTLADEPVISFPAFRATYLERWGEAHGALTKLVHVASRAEQVKNDVAPELRAYSFDRALVVADNDIAAMLVANNFHFENNCAVVSTEGFPPHRFATVMQMLRANPRLVVFAAHDASASGCLMAHRLRDDNWFADRAIRIVDLGLRPQHAIRLRLIAARGPAHSVPPELRGALSADEVAWLEAGYHAELAALRPARLMRALFQGFARAGRIDADTSVAPAGPDGVFIWGFDGGADVYAADSFG